MASNPIASNIHISLQQAAITVVVLTGLFSSLPAVVHSTIAIPSGEGESSSSVAVVVLRS